MPRNGNGNYNLPQPAFTPGTTISSTAVNSDFSDIASALTGSVSADGQTSITGQLRFPSGTAAAPAFTFASDLTTGMYYIGTGHLGFSTGGNFVVGFNYNNLGSGQNGNVLEINTAGGVSYPCPVGSVIDFAGSTAPAGWFLCYGQSLLASNYPELFQVIGTTYGTSGGNVVLPDCRGRFAAGKDNMGGSAANRITSALNFDATVLGGVGGAQSFTILTANLPAIKPAITITDTGHIHSGTFTVNATNITTQGNISAAGATTALTTGGSAATIATPSATTGVTAAFTSNLGSATAFGIINPTIIFNKIIYAGRP